MKSVISKNVKHGLHGTSEYWSWAMMKQRCLNPKYTQYSYYGGRGITICDEWLDFKNFIRDMGRKPSPQHSIDRVDSDGNYSPENCRWATRTQQAVNRGMNRNNTSGHKGVSKKDKRWRAYTMVDYKQVNLGTYPTKEEAIAARKNYDEANN